MPRDIDRCVYIGRYLLFLAESTDLLDDILRNSERPVADLSVPSGNRDFRVISPEKAVNAREFYEIDSQARTRQRPGSTPCILQPEMLALSFKSSSRII